jgi:cbb3-type cytochrome oxidase cytochrome c subunit
LRELSRQNGLRFAVIARPKELQSEVFISTWTALKDSVENKIRGRAMLITDVTDRVSVLRAIGRHPAGNHLAKAKHESTFQAKLVEDPIHMDSRHSRILQMVDLVAYLWRQKLRPNSLFQKKDPRELIRLTTRLTGTAE